MATTKYKTPKKVASVEVGGPSNVEELKRTQLSVGNNRSANYAGTKTSGIKIRGTGAATKGVMARGPMA
jgi:hypothetical protein